MCDHKAGCGLDPPRLPTYKEDFTFRLECFHVFHTWVTILSFPFLHSVFLVEFAGSDNLSNHNTHTRSLLQNHDLQYRSHDSMLEINTPANNHSVTNEERQNPDEVF